MPRNQNIASIPGLQAIVAAARQTKRVPRNPRHSFYIQHRPYVLQPFMIAPVVPGETLKRLTCQARVVSDPIKDPLIGWWNEKYYYYVKHRDLEIRDHLTELMLNPAKTLTSLNEAASVPYYHFGSTVNWLKECMKRIVQEDFRNHDENWDSFILDGLPQASINSQDFTHSAYLSSETPAGGFVDTPAPDIVDEKFRQWEHLQNFGLTQLTYDQWLEQYGVRPATETEDPHLPEMVRYQRSWTYPSNTIDPVSGAPSSALSWVDDFSADKDRYFKEPGFLVGFACVRPKVYLGNLKGSAVGLMNDMYSWLPAMTNVNEHHLSLKKVTGGSGPIQNSGVTPGGDYWLDIRDLLIHGDQFHNMPTVPNAVALPAAATMQRRFASSADVDALFKVATANKIRQDGITSMTILGTQQDFTPAS